MTDRQFNLVVRENLRAAAEHIRRGHTGRWRMCGDALCRDAQNFLPPLEALTADLEHSRTLVEAALTRLTHLESEAAAN